MAPVRGWCRKPLRWQTKTPTTGEKLTDVMTEINEGAGANIHSFDMRSYASGIYLIKLVRNGHFAVSKITLYN